MGIASWRSLITIIPPLGSLALKRVGVQGNSNARKVMKSLGAQFGSPPLAQQRTCFLCLPTPSTPSSSTFSPLLLPQQLPSSSADSPAFLQLFGFSHLNMPPRTRATLDVPIKPKHFWCMHCLRTSVKNFDPSADVAFEINCILDAKASVACQQCSSRNSTCIPVRFVNLS